MDNNIQKLREKNKIRTVALAKMLGVTRSTLYNYESGSPIPSDKLILLSEIFQCSTDYILGLGKEEVDTEGIEKEVSTIKESLLKILGSIKK